MEGLNSLTVVELKRLLREQGLAVSGNKSELISRLEGSQEEFLVIDEEENTTTVAKENTKEIPTEGSIGKVETYCRSCRAALRYPSDFRGALTCPRCKSKFKVNPKLGIGSILFRSSFAVFLLTIIIAIIYSVNDGSPEGMLSSGIAAGAVCMGGLTLSGILFGLALLYNLANKPLNLE
jgi:hypothetical protein